MVHEVAAAGFSDAGDYEAARPSYPPDAVAWLIENLRIGPGRRVVDLAAGTGKLTRLLVPPAPSWSRPSRSPACANVPLGGAGAFRSWRRPPSSSRSATARSTR